MKYNVSRVIPWVGAYVALALTPLVLAMVGSTPEPRPFVVEVGVGLGFVGVRRSRSQWNGVGSSSASTNRPGP